MGPVGLLEAKLVSNLLIHCAYTKGPPDHNVMLNLELFGFCFVRSAIWNISFESIAYMPTKNETFLSSGSKDRKMP